MEQQKLAEFEPWKSAKQMAQKIFEQTEKESDELADQVDQITVPKES